MKGSKMRRLLLVLLFLLPLYGFTIEKGWGLYGFSGDVSVAEFDDPSIVSLWKYKNGKWQVYSSDENLMRQAQELGLETFDTIYAGEGVWIHAKKECELSIQASIAQDYNIYYKRGWNLIASKFPNPLPVDVLATKDIYIVWTYERGRWLGWSPYSDLRKLLKDFGYPPIESLEPHRGVWVYGLLDNYIVLPDSSFVLRGVSQKIAPSDPVAVYFSKNIASMKKCHDFTVVDEKDSSVIEGECKEHNTTLLFVPKQPLVPSKSYKVIVGENIQTKSGAKLGQTYKFNIATQADDGVEIECGNDILFSEENLTCYMKSNLQVAKIVEVNYTIGNKHLRGPNLLYTLPRSGVYTLKLSAKDNLGRSFEASKEIYAFDNLAKNKLFTNLGTLENLLPRLNDASFWSDDGDFYYVMQQFPGDLLSFWGERLPLSKNALLFVHSYPLLMWQLPKKLVNAYVNKYVERMIESDKLVGFANFYGFLAILSYRDTKNSDVKMLDILFENGGCDINTYYNGKVRLYDPGVSKIPTFIRVSFLISEDNLQTLQNEYGSNLGGIENLRYFKMEHGTIYTGVHTTQRVLARRLNFGWNSIVASSCDGLGSVCDSCGDACNEAADAVSNAIDKIFDYFSQTVLDVLDGIEDVYNNTIKKLAVFDKISTVVSTTKSLKNKISTLSTTYAEDASNIFSTATDPDKVVEKLQDFLYKSDTNLKSFVHSFTDKAEGTFADVADLLLDNLKENMSASQENLKNFLQNALPSKEMLLEFKLDSAAHASIEAKYDTSDATLSINTIQSVIDTIDDWSSAVGIDLSSLLSHINGFTNALSGSFSGKLGFYFTPDPNPLNDSLQMGLFFDYTNHNLLKLLLTLKPTNPNALIRLGIPQGNTYISFLFEPYNFPVPEVPNEANTTKKAFFDKVFASFIDDTRPFPNAYLTFHTRFLGKADLTIEGELFPTPQISQAVKFGEKVGEYMGLGAGEEAAFQAGISFPLTFGYQNILYTAGILSDVIMSLEQNASNYFTDNGVCLLLNDIYQSFVQSPFFSNALGKVGLNLDFAVSGNIGAGAGGTGAGAEATAAVGGGASFSTTMQVVGAMMQIPPVNCPFSPKEYVKYLLQNFPLTSTKDLVMLFGQGWKEKLQAYGANFLHTLAAESAFGGSISLQQSIGAQAIGSAQFSTTESFSYGFNGELFLNTLYFALSKMGVDVNASYFDNPTVYPEIQFALERGGELEYGMELGVEVKGVTSVSFPLLEGALAFLYSPAEDSQGGSSIKISPYPLVFVRSESNGTKVAKFASTIALDDGVSVSSYRWSVDGKDLQTAASDGIVEVIQESKDRLEVRFVHSGKHLVGLLVQDSNGKKARATPVLYTITNNPPSTPILNVADGAKVGFPYNLECNSSDSDGDNVQYHIVEAEDANFHTIVHQKDCSQNCAVGSHYTGKDLYIKVTAYDGESDSAAKIIHLQNRYYIEISVPKDGKVYPTGQNLPIAAVTPYLSATDIKEDHQIDFMISQNPNFPDDSTTHVWGSFTNGTWRFAPWKPTQDGKYYYRASYNIHGDVYCETKTASLYAANFRVNIVHPDKTIYTQADGNITLEVTTPDVSEEILLLGDYNIEFEIAKDANFTQIVATRWMYYDEMAGWLAQNADSWQPEQFGTYFMRAVLYYTGNQDTKQMYGHSDIKRIEYVDKFTINLESPQDGVVVFNDEGNMTLKASLPYFQDIKYESNLYHIQDVQRRFYIYADSNLSKLVSVVYPTKTENEKVTVTANWQPPYYGTFYVKAELVCQWDGRTVVRRTPAHKVTYLDRYEIDFAKPKDPAVLLRSGENMRFILTMPYFHPKAAGFEGDIDYTMDIVIAKDSNFTQPVTTLEATYDRFKREYKTNLWHPDSFGTYYARAVYFKKDDPYHILGISSARQIEYVDRYTLLMQPIFKEGVCTIAIDTPYLYEANSSYQVIVEVAKDNALHSIVALLEKKYDNYRGWKSALVWQPSEEGTYYMRAKLYRFDEANASYTLLFTSQVQECNTTEPERVLFEEDFDTLDGWKKVPATSGSSLAEIVDGALHYKRVGYDGSKEGVEKDVNIDISECNEAYIELDVKVVSNSLSSSGWWSYEKGGIGEFPAMVILDFYDSDDKHALWAYGFLEKEDSYHRSNYTQVQKGEWYHFKSTNLVKEKTTETLPHNKPKESGTIKRITKIFVGGVGHSFEGYFDNLKIVCK